MGKIANLIANLKALTVEKQVSDLAKIVAGHEETILDMNRDQMKLGETSEGVIIGKYSNPVYEAFKENLNPKGQGNVDLELTGGFKKEMFMSATSFPMTIDSTDEKRNKLIDGDGYTTKVFGINEPNKEKLRQEVKEEIQSYYRGKILNL